MDPLFERRELLRTIHIDARYIQRNMSTAILGQLKTKYEGKCVSEGFINTQSIRIVSYSLGRTNLMKGGLDYSVKFQADICFPHPGQVLKAPVTLISKIGVHAQTTPIRVLIPRDLHMTLEGFDKIVEKQEIEFEVVGARFQQGDDHIVVLGKLREIIAPAEVEIGLREDENNVDIPMEDEKKGENEKMVVRVSPEVVRPDTAKRRTIKVKDGQTKEGSTEGNA